MDSDDESSPVEKAIENSIQFIARPFSLLGGFARTQFHSFNLFTIRMVMDLLRNNSSFVPRILYNSNNRNLIEQDLDVDLDSCI